MLQQIGEFRSISHLVTLSSLQSCIPEWAPYNWDGLSWSDTKAYDAVLDTKHVIISEAYHLPDPENPVEVEENEVSAAWYGDVLGPNGHDPSEPVSVGQRPKLSSIDVSVLTQLRPRSSTQTADYRHLLPIA